MIADRSTAKLERNFQAADAIQLRLEAAGIKTDDIAPTSKVSYAALRNVDYKTGVLADGQWTCECGWTNREQNLLCGNGKPGFGCGKAQPGAKRKEKNRLKLKTGTFGKRSPSEMEVVQMLVDRVQVRDCTPHVFHLLLL